MAQENSIEHFTKMLMEMNKRLLMLELSVKLLILLSMEKDKEEEGVKE